MSVALLILGLVLFVMLVVVHEFGHFIVARRNGVEVEEFGIFFPPRLWKHKTKGGWDFTINLIPLGGFVRLKGESDSATGKGTFGEASLGVKTKIMLAGVTMNLLAAFALLTLLGWIGMPQLIENQFMVKSDTHYIKRVSVMVQASDVEAGSPAAVAGIKTNDTLVSIGSRQHPQAISSADGLPSLTAKYAGQTVHVSYKHNGTEYDKSVTLRSKAQIAAAKAAGKDEGYLGVAVDQNQNGLSMTRSTWSAPIQAAGLIAQTTVLTFHGLGLALHGLGSTIAGLVTGNHAAREAGQTQASGQVGGPIAIFEILKAGSVYGIQFVLMFIAIISLTLAIINVLPIPALDGGKLFLTLLARAFHKTLSERTEAAIYGSGFAVLIAIIILTIIADLHR